MSSFTILKVKALKVQIVRHRQDISSWNTLTAAIFMETPSVSKITSVRIKTTNTGSVDDTNSGRVRKPNPPMVCDSIWNCSTFSVCSWHLKSVITRLTAMWTAIGGNVDVSSLTSLPGFCQNTVLNSRFCGGGLSRVAHLLCTTYLLWPDHVSEVKNSEEWMFLRPGTRDRWKVSLDLFQFNSCSD